MQVPKGYFQGDLPRVRDQNKARPRYECLQSIHDFIVKNDNFTRAKRRTNMCGPT